MKNRREARESVLQALYQCDTCDDWSLANIHYYFEYFHLNKQEKDDSDKETNVTDLSTKAQKGNIDFARKLILGITDNLDVVDERISEASSRWNIQRMSRIDRNILRLGAYELLFLAEIVPVNVVLNEAIEIAKSFGSDDTPTFINGILDNIANVEKVQKVKGSNYKQIPLTPSTNLHKKIINS